VLRVLADVSGLNVIATDDVKGKVTLHLTDVPWDQALDLVLRANRLEKTHEGNVVRISTVSRLKEEREALRAAQDAERELEPLRVKVHPRQLRARRRGPHRQGEGRAHRPGRRHLRRSHQHHHRARHPARRRGRERAHP
jgi:hypothetical protein